MDNANATKPGRSMKAGTDSPVIGNICAVFVIESEMETERE